VSVFPPMRLRQTRSSPPAPRTPRAGPSQPTPALTPPPPPPAPGVGSALKSGAAAAEAFEHEGESSPQSVSSVRSPVLLLLRLVNRGWWFRVWGFTLFHIPPPPSLSDPFPFVFPDASGSGAKIGARTRSAGSAGTFEGPAAASGDRSAG